MPPKKRTTSAKADKISVETSSDKSSDNVDDNSSNEPKPVIKAKKATKEVFEAITNGDTSPSPPAKRSKKSPGAGKGGETTKEEITNGESNDKESKRKNTKSTPESSMDSIPENEEVTGMNNFESSVICLKTPLSLIILQNDFELIFLKSLKLDRA